MKQRVFPRIEDILEELTDELNQRGFSRIATEKAERGEMKAVLREAITYIGEYMTVNMEMLERTRTLRI